MRRALRVSIAALLCAALSLGAQTPPNHYTPVTAAAALNFPVDHGAHPGYRTEWWYVTGWLNTSHGPQGFQITFFRTQPMVDSANPSAFTPKQIVFAHAALSDPATNRLLQGQRIAREGFGLSEAPAGDAHLVLGDWLLRRDANNRFSTRVHTDDFTLDLSLSPTQPVMLQGDHGYSEKGPLPQQASHYYSLPHLAVAGQLRRGDHVEHVSGEAWFDHEWSSNLLDPRSVGWDWTGLNLDDGGALMAFQVRDAKGDAVWAGGGYRDRSGAYVNLKPADVSFATQRVWHSPQSGANYPVQRVLTVQLPAGLRHFTLSPLFDNQELDTRATGGPVYWEGAVKTEEGRGYLELTGYATSVHL